MEDIARHVRAHKMVMYRGEKIGYLCEITGNLVIRVKGREYAFSPAELDSISATTEDGIMVALHALRPEMGME